MQEVVEKYYLDVQPIGNFSSRRSKAALLSKAGDACFLLEEKSTMSESVHSTDGNSRMQPRFMLQRLAYVL